MSEWQMPANLMSIATSCGPGARRVMVVLVSGSVADVAAYAETVFIAPFFSSSSSQRVNPGKSLVRLKLFFYSTVGAAIRCTALVDRGVDPPQVVDDASGRD